MMEYLLLLLIPLILVAFKYDYILMEKRANKAWEEQNR